MSVNCASEMAQKEVITVFFKVMSQNLHGGIEKTNDDLSEDKRSFG
jgi:hypothetical protein